jgi:hypothetical protein
MSTLRWLWVFGNLAPKSIWYTGNSRYKEVLAHPQKIRYNLKFVVSKTHVITKFSILGHFSL